MDRTRHLGDGGSFCVVTTSSVKVRVPASCSLSASWSCPGQRDRRQPGPGLPRTPGCEAERPPFKQILQVTTSLLTMRPHLAHLMRPIKSTLQSRSLRPIACMLSVQLSCIGNSSRISLKGKRRGMILRWRVVTSRTFPLLSTYSFKSNTEKPPKLS